MRGGVTSRLPIRFKGFWPGGLATNDVNEGKNDDPNGIDKVPVPGDQFGRLALSREAAAGFDAPQNTHRHDPNGDVECVKANQGIKSASKGIGADREVVFGNQAIPFVAGSREEKTSEQNGDSQPCEIEDMMAPGAGPEGKINRATTAEQADRVDDHEPQAKRVGRGGHFFRIGSGDLIAQKHDIGRDQGAE